MQGWRGARGEPGARREHQRGQSPASARPARRASDRSSSSGGGGGGAAPSPPPEGSTDNKSWAEKRTAARANPVLNSASARAGHDASEGARVPGARVTASTGWGCALPQLWVAAGAQGGWLQVALAQRLGGRGSEPTVGPERGPPRCSGLAHRCQDWQTRRCSWLAPVTPQSPRPLSFLPPPFPTTPAAAASKCKKCQGDFPGLREDDHLPRPQPFLDILACPSWPLLGLPAIWRNKIPVLERWDVLAFFGSVTTPAFRQLANLSRFLRCLECTKQVLPGSAWCSTGSSGYSPASPRRSCRWRGVFCSARNPPAAAAAAAAPGLRAGCSRASSVTLRVAPQAAAPAISANRQPGASPQGFPLSLRCPLQVVGCPRERSLHMGPAAYLVGSLRLKRQLSRPLLFILVWAYCSGNVQKWESFPNFLSSIWNPTLSVLNSGTFAHTHSQECTHRNICMDKRI